MKTATDLLYVIPFQKMEQIKGYTMQCLKTKRMIPSSYCESRIILLGNRLSVLVFKADFNRLIEDIESLLNFKIDTNTLIDTSKDVENNISKLEVKTIKDKIKWIKKPFCFIDEEGNQAYIKLDDKRFSTIPVRQSVKQA